MPLTLLIAALVGALALSAGVLADAQVVVQTGIMQVLVLCALH